MNIKFSTFYNFGKSEVIGAKLARHKVCTINLVIYTLGVVVDSHDQVGN